MAKLVLTRGLPASGKSTFALEWVQEDNQWRSRVNRDELRFNLYGRYVLDRMGEETTTTAQHALVRTLLLAKKDVIVDDTNLAARFVKEWLKLAKEVGAEVEFVDFDTDVEECVRRDKARGAAGGREVGETVIRSFAARYTRKGKLPVQPTLDETVATFKKYTKPETGRTAYLVDIDGTLAQMNGRGPFEWHRVGEDTPIQDVIDTVSALRTAGHEIIFMSGRDEVCREQTISWLETAFLEYAHVAPMLYMRPQGDMRKDSIVKHELFWANVAPYFDIIGVIDDRQQVVDMWREIGLTVFQCAKGDF